MLTTKLNNNTFIVNGVTFTAGQQVELKTKEQRMLDRCVELATSLSTVKPELLSTCYKETAPYNVKLAEMFFSYEQDNREFTYLAGTLMHEICSRLGGLIPLRIQTEGLPGVFVREITNESESVVLTTDAIRRGSRFDRYVGDAKNFICSLISPNSSESLSKTTCIPNNWTLLGAPYVFCSTTNLPFDFLEADQFSEFKWEKFENTPIDTILLNAFAAMLSTNNRLEQLKTGAWPFPMLTCLVGVKETIVINMSEMLSNQPNLNILAREINRIKAKYVFLLQFGLINTNGSTHDYTTTPVSGPVHGFTLSIIMRSKISETLLMGGKAWRIEAGPDKEPVLNVHATYEGNTGLTDPNIRDVFEDIFKFSRPEPVAV